MGLDVVQRLVDVRGRVRARVGVRVRIRVRLRLRLRGRVSALWTWSRLSLLRLLTRTSSVWGDR